MNEKRRTLLNVFESNMYEQVDLCACYEPMSEAPQELIDEWVSACEFEGQDEVPAFYVTEGDGPLYFYYGNTRIKVSEHFSDKGKPIGMLLEDVIRYSAAHQTAGI